MSFIFVFLLFLPLLFSPSSYSFHRFFSHLLSFIFIFRFCSMLSFSSFAFASAAVVIIISLLPVVSLLFLFAILFRGCYRYLFFILFLFRPCYFYPVVDIALFLPSLSFLNCLSSYCQLVSFSPLFFPSSADSSRCCHFSSPSLPTSPLIPVTSSIPYYHRLFSLLSPHAVRSRGSGVDPCRGEE